MNNPKYARLLLLIAKMKKMGSKRKFSMRSWVHCPGGYAARMKVFNEMGLKSQGMYGPSYQNLDPCSSIEQFFGLTWFQSRSLFGTNIECSTSKEWIVIAEKFIDEHSKS